MHELAALNNTAGHLTMYVVLDSPWFENNYAGRTQREQFQATLMSHLSTE